jgi:saccharopine dehydrogenase (NADP+, L-glutamate forming)
MFEQEAINFAASRPRCHPVTLNVSAEGDKLNELVAAHDLVVSLVPAPFHPLVARAAIANGKNMVTASYVSPELAELQAEAKAAGVVILNEVGLDPGIDHISAVALLDAVKRTGQKILSFSSNCGGLPAPEAAGNRLGYKFSWSPRGVLTASRNAAKWLSGGALVSVPGENLMASSAPYALFKNPAFDLEVLPNRDCRGYAEKYGIPDVPHIFRGTLRYGGFPKLMFAFATLGFLDLTPNPALTKDEGDESSAPDYTKGPPLKGVLAQCAGLDPAHVLGGQVDDTGLISAIETKVRAAWNAAATSVETARTASDALVASETNAKQLAGEVVQQSSLWNEKDTSALEAVLRDLDFFEASKPAPRTRSGTALDTFTAVLSAAPQLSYGPTERDAALMQHEVLASSEDGTVTRHVSTLVQYGDLETKVSCMSFTVGVTAAIGVQLILDGKGGSAEPGVHTPVTDAWWQPMLAALAAEGIALTESSEVLSPATAQAVLKYLGDK